MSVKKGSSAPPSIQCGRPVVGDPRKAQQLKPELVVVVHLTSARHRDIPSRHEGREHAEALAQAG
jgi:hypothetical protein